MLLFLTETIEIKWTEHTHTHPFNAPLSGTTRVNRYQKGKTNLDFTEARDSEWLWHHASVHLAPDTQAMPALHHSVFYRPDALPATQPTVSKHWTEQQIWPCFRRAARHERRAIASSILPATDAAANVQQTLCPQLTLTSLYVTHTHAATHTYGAYTVYILMQIFVQPWL